MAIAKHSTPSQFSAGDLAFIINQNYPVSSSMTALLCRIEGAAENGKVACEGLKIMDENGTTCTFYHNDKNLTAVINRVGENFEADQSILHSIKPTINV